MRIYARTGKNTGISMGPIGWFIVGSLYAVWVLFAVSAWAAYHAVLGISWLAAAAVIVPRARKAGKLNDNRKADRLRRKLDWSAAFGLWSDPFNFNTEKL